jgi:hypothetical protein
MIKYVILIFSLLIIAFHQVQACSNSIPMSEVVKAVALEPDAGSKTCADLPQEQCVCYDGIDWNSADLVDNEVVDFIRKEQVDSCASPEECQLKLEALVCVKGKPIMTESEVYCAVEMMKKDGKKLVESPVKKAAKELKENDEKEALKLKLEARKLARERLKALNPDGARTIADLKAMVRDLIEAVKE